MILYSNVGIMKSVTKGSHPLLTYLYLKFSLRISVMLFFENNLESSIISQKYM